MLNHYYFNTIWNYIEDGIPQFNHRVILSVLFSIICLILCLKYSIISSSLFSKCFTTTQFVSKNQRDVVLLLGPRNSGKTSLFYLIQNLCWPTLNTVTSICPNQIILNKKCSYSELFSLLAEKYTDSILVDFPGGSSLTHDYQHYLKRAKCIIFLIDASDKDQFKNLADNLYDLCTNEDLIHNEIPLFLQFNKIDKVRGKPKHFIKLDLLKELECLRKAKTLNNENEFDQLSDIGVIGQQFDFDRAHITIKLGYISIKNKQIQDMIDMFSESTL